MSIDLYSQGKPFGRTVVKNLLKKWASSENLLSPGWQGLGGAGAVIDTTQENAVDLTAISSGGLTVLLETGTVLAGDTIVVSFDAWSTDLAGEQFEVRPFDAVGAFDGVGAPFDITLTATRTRYSLVVDCSGGIFGDIARVAFHVEGTHTGTFYLDRVMVENVTGRSNQNPSSYVPNSVSKQLNSRFHQPSTVDPGTTVALGACALMDQDGWCWGTSSLWTIASNTMTGANIGGSLHSRIASLAGRAYDYRYVLATQNMGALQVAGVALTTSTDDAGANPIATGTHTGRLIGTAIDSIVLGSQGAVAGSVFSEFSVIECDAETNVDGVAFRGSAGDLAVDGTTKVVTET